MRKLIRLFGIFTFSAVAALPAQAAVVATQAFTAVQAPHALPLDPSLSDPLWATGAVPAATYQNVTTRRPATLVTNVDLLYDNKNLYVGFHAEQAGVPIVATQSANDVGFGVDDFVGIGIDTSGNGSQVYYFETTPKGVRYQQANENARYRPDWQAAAKIQGDAWNAVMIIPLKALRISAGSEHTWRFNLVRGIASAGEHYSWAFDGLMQDQSSGNWPAFPDVRFWPTLHGLKIAGSGAAVRPQPRLELYGLSSTGQNRNLFAQADGEFLPETIRNAGADFTYPVTNTINFVGTVNPDFSNVEIDQQTIAPQEFRRGLQEYRPFFAQGANFINSNASPIGGFVTPPDLIFYSPGVGPFDRGAKVEGAFGKQSFGILNFRGYDQVTGNQFDDVAYGFKHAEPTRTFLYWADGVLAHHSLFGTDSTNEIGVAGRNLKTGFVWSVDTAAETGTWVPAPGYAHSNNMFVDVHKPNYETYLGYIDISPNYNPIDGVTTASDVRGFDFFVNPSGSTPGLKNWNIFAYGDRYLDRSGHVHQADSLVSLSAALKNGISINGVGPSVGVLRGYALDDPAKYPLGCNDQHLPVGFFTGFPNYQCGRDVRFDLFGGGLGYRDGTPAPLDFSYNYGPFGSNYLHLFSVTTSRPLGSRFSVSGEYDGTFERSLSTGHLESQTLRRITFGETLGSDSNLSVSLRSISGIGGFALPGINLAANYHRHFPNGNDLYINYGTPAASTTLNRLIMKYVFRFGGGAGT